MSEARIEAATIEDLPALTDLLLDLFTKETDFKPDRIKQMRGLRLILEQPNRGRIFVVREHNAIAGMINLLFTISTAEGGFVMLLEDLVVHPNYRARGFGTKLLEYAIEYARQKDFMRITLLTDQLDEPTKTFFARKGFFTSGMVPMRLLLSSDPSTPGPKLSTHSF